MRIRTALAAFGAAVLSVGLVAAPANAGTGSSTWCGDGVGYREVPILTSPVTVGLEIYESPTSATQKVIVCFSTTSVGQPGIVTGGAVWVDIARDTSLATPGASADLSCRPDVVAGVFPTCSLWNGVTVATGDVAVTTPPSSICLVSLGSGCVAYVPGVKLVTGGDIARPLLALELLSVPVNLDVPQQCVALVVTCP